MKLVVIGLGQCGCRVADEFARLNRQAKAQRGIEIVPGAFAVNTDAADLSGLKYIKPDYQYRILIGGRKTNGHGVGKINELGAEVARSDGDKVIDSIRSVKSLFEADAFMLVASAGGGTGSGSIAIITKLVKERWPDVPVYDLVVLPFEHEQETEERTIYNCATCLKAVNTVADAVFLVDNQRYVAKDFSLMNNLSKINSLIASPFYNMLCAGEEKKQQYIGAKTLDAGDIMATISGWSVIGYGESDVSRVRLPFEQNKNFIKKSHRDAQRHPGDGFRHRRPVSFLQPGRCRKGAIPSLRAGQGNEHGHGQGTGRLRERPLPAGDDPVRRLSERKRQSRYYTHSLRTQERG